ncbi:MAG: HAD-IA family hydrolase [Roseibium album]|uniref:HAD family hydrolase n=1 Tax=Roseibium album TaxID=311410 RepID=UPI0032EAEF98
MTDHISIKDRSMVRGVVFDLDGTLVDSAGTITTAVNAIISGRKVPPYNVSDVAAFIGDGPDWVLRRALNGRGLHVTQEDTLKFARLYEECSVAESVLFPGIESVLEELLLLGNRLAVCTNKPAAATRRLLHRLNIDRMFSAVCCGDECNHRKPHPTHLQETLRRIDPLPATAVMIGDHRNDMLAANGCGLPGIFAEWGARLPDNDSNLNGCVVAGRVRQPQDIPAILNCISESEAASSPDLTTRLTGLTDCPIRQCL